MNKLQDKASLSERSVQKVAKDNIQAPRRTRGKATRPPSSRVSTRKWNDKLGPELTSLVEDLKIDISRVEVKGLKEIIIWNPDVPRPKV